MGRLSTGWNLTKVSLRVLRGDKQLLLFPLLSGVTLLLILAGFVGAIFLSVGFEGMFQGSSAWVSGILLFVYYVVAFFVGLFFNAAVIGAAMIRLNGGHPTLSDGLRIARENVGRIFLWALFAATVAMIIRAIQERVGIIGKIIMGIVGVAWTLATFFVVPVLIYEKLGPWAAVKRSASIFRRTWGEAFTGQFTMGGIFVLAGLAGLVPIFLGIALGGVLGVLIGGIIAFVYWVVLGIVASAANSILVAALYRFATTGKVAEDFQGLPMFGAPTRQTYGQVP
ncbi:MAG TPA: DUF6159 family protein [Thermoplasmata archaeon]|nr:DUF6159 family protein [Thermoplasmata archaeon]